MFLGHNFFVPEKKVVSPKKNFFSKFFYVPELVGFQTRLIIFKKFNSMAFDFLFRSCLIILCHKVERESKMILRESKEATKDILALDILQGQSSQTGFFE